MDNYTRVEPANSTAFPIAKAGLPYVGIAAFATAVFALLGMAFLALTGLAATFFICFFFRDPDRVIPNREGAVVSPADGKVIKVETLEKGRFCLECHRLRRAILKAHSRRWQRSPEVNIKVVFEYVRN